MYVLYKCNDRYQKAPNSRRHLQLKEEQVVKEWVGSVVFLSDLMEPSWNHLTNVHASLGFKVHEKASEGTLRIRAQTN